MFTRPHFASKQYSSWPARQRRSWHAPDTLELVPDTLLLCAPACWCILLHLLPQVKHVKHNLQIIMHNPNHSFLVDPNGFVVPVKQTEEQAAAAAKAAKAKEVAALNSNHGSLFDHLLKNVLGEQQQQPAASSLVDQMNHLHEQQEEQTKDLKRPWNNGNGNGNGKQLQGLQLQQPQQQQPACTASMLSADAQAEKQAFLGHYGKDYGYGGLLDQLYPCEVRLLKSGTAAGLPAGCFVLHADGKPQSDAGCFEVALVVCLACYECVVVDS